MRKLPGLQRPGDSARRTFRARAGLELFRGLIDGSQAVLRFGVLTLLDPP
jgi:hypothetical protein